MPPVSTAGGVEVIHGDTSGNSTEMSVTVDGQAARIIAAKPGTVFWRVPEAEKAGGHEVTFVPGPGKTPVKLRLIVIRLQMSADQYDLIRGQWTKLHVLLTGLEDLPASAWESGMPPDDLVSLKDWQDRSGGIKPPGPHGSGVVVLILDNKSPETIRMGKHGDRVVLELHQRDFARGAYTYEDKIQSLRRGTFNILGSATVFLKPSAGEAL